MAKLPDVPAGRNVLLVMINHHLGNFVVAMPFIEVLARHYAGRADLLVDSRFAELARLIPSVARVIPHDQRDRRGNLFARTRSFFRTLSQLARARYGIVFDVSGGIQSVTLTCATLSRHRIGLQKSRRSWCYSVRLPPVDGRHAVDRFMPFMHLLGRTDQPILELKSPQRDGSPIPESHQRIVLIHPTAGQAYRSWPKERFAAVADQLIESHRVFVVFIGTQKELPLIQEMRDLMKQKASSTTLATDLVSLVGEFNRASLLISNESGPTHVAAATRIPIVTIFGPGKEERWRPARKENVTVLRGMVCPGDCPRGACRHDGMCLTSLSVEQVVTAARRYLDVS